MRPEHIPMRKANREITDFEELLKVVDTCDVVRLGMNTGDLPYILPVNYGYEVVDGQLLLYIHCATEGYKLTLLDADPRVSFEMDCNHVLQYFEERGYCTMAYESIMGTGHVEALEGADKVHGLDLLMQHYHEGETKFYSPAAIPRTRVYRLVVESMTGKKKPLK